MAYGVFIDHILIFLKKKRVKNSMAENQHMIQVNY